MSLYWLQPGWTSARCACGVNIHASGGDPDWGECFECFSARYSQQQPEPTYRCDICKTGVAVASANGYFVCSEACDHEAMSRPAPTPAGGPHAE